MHPKKSMFLYTIFCALSLLFMGTTLSPFSFFRKKPNPITIVLDPAGDAHHSGRTIGDTTERSITMHYGEQLKKTLEDTYPHVRVIMTRLPGEVVQPLQHANFANRLAADLYISIHCYQEERIKPHWYIYSFSYGDDFIFLPSSLSLYTYDKAYLTNKQTTQRWATQIAHTLNQEPYIHHYLIKGPYRLPIKPLIGITAPAFLFEIGLKNPDDWPRAVTTTVACLAPLIAECQS